MLEAAIIGVGRGRGNATNVPERALIEQVRARPLLYDKSQVDYRKPGVSDSTWSEVAKTLNTSVANCKKRWKSLRDTFIKYFRYEVMATSNGDNKRRHKSWNFYDDLSFLKSHVELFRMDEAVKDMNESQSPFSKTQEEEREVYEIKIAGGEYEEEDDVTFSIKEDHLEGYEDQIADEYEIIEHEEEALDKPEKLFSDDYETYETEAENYEPETPEIIEENQFNVSPAPSNRLHNDSEVHVEVHQKPSPDNLPNIAISSSTKNIVDPEERYLMSCLPAFKRFTPQQKAYVRMGIERLFYEVEFENVSEPKNKRSRMS